MIYNGMLNVRAFGAKGDGSSDDTDAIDEAIRTASTANKALFFPAGYYRVTSIDVALPANGG